jgi:hypothetical protein
MKQPSKERGCNGKMKLGKQPRRKARQMSTKHGKQFGVYKCPHCKSHHLTTKIENVENYKPLVYVTPPTALNLTQEL